MNGALLVIFTAHLTFAAYLLLAGAGPVRTFKVCGWAFAATAFLLLVLTIVIPVLLLGGREVYLQIAVVFTVFMLPSFALGYAREFALPRIGLAEVVFMNGVALGLGGNGDAIQFLLNPFYLQMKGVTWLNFAIGTWPSLLAFALADNRPPGNTALRVVLVVWIQLIGLVWLLPIVVKSLIDFDTTTLLSYGKSALACLCGVYVLMIAFNLWTVFFVKDGRREGRGVFRELADDLYLNGWPWPAYLAVGAAGYLLAWMLRGTALDADLAISIAYSLVVLVGTWSAARARVSAASLSGQEQRAQP